MFSSFRKVEIRVEGNRSSVLIYRQKLEKDHRQSSLQSPLPLFLLRLTFPIKFPVQLQLVVVEWIKEFSSCLLHLGVYLEGAGPVKRRAEEGREAVNGRKRD